MKKILLVIIWVLLLTGCTNKEIVSFYENTKAGEKIDSYQLDIRIYGNYGNKKYSESVKVDNFKGTQYKIDYISRDGNALRESLSGEDNLNTDDSTINKFLGDNASYIIDNKMYERVDGKLKEVSSLLYSNPDVYLEVVSKATEVEYLKDETRGDAVLKVYTFKVSVKDMENILNDGVLKGLELKNPVPAKVWVDKDQRISNVVYYIKNGTDNLEINVSVFRINLINDMSNKVK